MKRLLFALFLMIWTLPAIADTYRPITYYEFGISTTAARHNEGIQPHTYIARVICDADCFVAFPVTPIVDANTTMMFLQADREEYFKVSPGTFVYVGTRSGTGTVYVTEME
jgi:hypothetical protein